MIQRVHAERVVAAPPERAFPAATDAANLSRYFRGFPPLVPGIREARMEGDGAVRKGAIRRVVMRDGSRIAERIVEHEPPRKHRYEMAEMNALQRLVCTQMVSDWTFERVPGGTRVVWEYTIHTHRWAPVPVVRVLAWALRQAMDGALGALAADLG